MYGNKKMNLSNTQDEDLIQFYVAFLCKQPGCVQTHFSFSHLLILRVTLPSLFWDVETEISQRTKGKLDYLGN